jgi:hypothetical protein
MELSRPVAEAVPRAVELVRSLVEQLTSERTVKA